MGGLGEVTDPGALIAGDPSREREQATLWAAHARSIEVAAASHRSAVVDSWTGAGADAFESARERHLARVEAAGAAYRDAAFVLRSHAEDVEAALRSASRAIEEWSRGEAATAAARREYDQEQARAASTPLALPVVSVFVDPGVAIRDNAEALLDDARAAVAESDAATARVLGAIADRAFTGSVFGSAPIPAGLAEVMAHAGEKKLLRDLRRMSPAELQSYAAAHPGLLARLLDLGPASVAAWWRGLDDATRSRLAQNLPRVIGNLDGVDARTRSEVNARMLTNDIADAEKRRDDARKLLESSDPGTRAAARAIVEREEKLLAELNTIRRAFGGGPDGTPPHQLYAYQPGDRTKVALSTGLIDDADHISLIVPGMGTTAGDVGRYGIASATLREQQSFVSGVDLSKVAVIAWLDYDPPGPLDVVGVARNELAQAGADRLGNTLQGLQGIQEWGEHPSGLSVVAHSYGTNVAAIALARPGVSAGNVVLLGSAGVSGGAPAAAGLHVPLGGVFATQANADEWAPLGQVISARADPTNPDYGAHVFTSEQANIDGKQFAGVGKHGPFGPKEVPSYLDGLSSAHYATAKATMGRGDELPYEGTPDDRSRWRVQNPAQEIGR